LCGIKWLKMKAKRRKHKKNYQNEDDEDEDEDEDDDSDDDDDEDEDDDEDTDKKPPLPQPTPQLASTSASCLFTTSLNDPILIAHSKCLKHDILSSWKRVIDPLKMNKKIKKVIKHLKISIVNARFIFIYETKRIVKVFN
jgi:hypothetical protein